MTRFVTVMPLYAYLRVTENCNSECKTCYAWRNKSKEELTTEEIKRALRQLKSLGVELVWLSGGEPLLRSDIGELIKECKFLGFKEIFVQTNGLLLSEKAEELVMNGATHIDVSIDGIGKTDDWIRGIPHAYEKATEGIEAVNWMKKRLGLKLPGITVFTTLLKQNLQEIPQLIDLCRKLRVFWDFSLLDNNVDFFKEINVSEFRIIDHKKIDELINYLKKSLRDTPRVISPVHTELSLEFARHYLKGNSNRLPCILGFTHICIGSHGEVYSGCLSSEPVGNLRGESLLSIVKSVKYRENARRMYTKKCSGCTFFFTSNLFSKHLISYWFANRWWNSLGNKTKVEF